jgi:predicted DNA binding CopG/RHH family protein
MRRVIRLTERDLTRLVKRIVNEGVTISETAADYNDVSQQMRPGTQTSATLYFDEDKSIRMRVGSGDFLLFTAPDPRTPSPTPTLPNQGK